MKKLIAVLLALSCMLIGAAAVAETLNVAYMPNYGSLWAVETAINKGYFEEEGLTLNLVEFADGPTIIAARARLWPTLPARPPRISSRTP